MYVCIFSITEYNVILDATAETKKEIERSRLCHLSLCVCVCCHSANICDDIVFKSLCLFLHVVCLFVCLSTWLSELLVSVGSLRVM